MRKTLLMLGAAMLFLGAAAPMPAYAGGHWVCPEGVSYANDFQCWWKNDDIEYRGKPKTQPVDDILKAEKAKAKDAAAKLEGKALVEAANAAMLEARIAKLKVAALNNRIAQLRTEAANQKKKGIKKRGYWIRYGNCIQWYDDWGFPTWWQCNW